MQINHTVFEKKHHYMSVLKEAEILKRQAEYEVLNGTSSKERLNEIYELRDMAFAGLIREKLVYQYIQNATEIKKDIVRLTIDNVDYECKATTLKNILGNEYESYIEEGKQRVLFPGEKKQVRVKTPADISVEAEKKTNDDCALDSTEDIDANTEIENLDTVIIPESPQQETSKSRDSFLYDEGTVTTIMDGAERGDVFSFVVAPLQIEINNENCKIVAYMKQKEDDFVLSISDETGAAKITIGNHSFIIRGVFSNGSFESFIYATGLTLSSGYNLNIQKQEFRPSKLQSAGRGHVFYSIKDVNAHVIPIKQTNDSNGTAKSIIVLQKNNQESVFLYPDASGCVGIAFENKEYQFSNIWINNTFKSNILTISETGTEKDNDRKKARMYNFMNNIYSPLYDLFYPYIMCIAKLMIVLSILTTICFFIKPDFPEYIDKMLEKRQTEQLNTESVSNSEKPISLFYTEQDTSVQDLQ